MEEIWKICHLTDKYSVSNLGRVRNNESKKIIKSSINKKGYSLVHLDIYPKRITYRLHRLMMFAFNNVNYFEGAVINHIDGNKLNNNLENLEWCTIKENNVHAYQNNLNHMGENRTDSKLTDNHVLEIKRLYNENTISQKELSKMFNVCQKTIWSVVNKKSWKHLS